ncbi:MAG: hypothetical protein Q7S79_03400 [bacterium]|nr:hypothetical protein [bacterium]
MRCEICTNDPQLLYSLPIPNSQGAFDTYVCGGCAYESEHYCHKHDNAHTLVLENSSACGDCVEEVVREKGEKVGAAFSVGLTDSPIGLEVGAIVAVYLMGIKGSIRSPRLGEWPYVAKIMGANDAQHIARPIITYAMCRKLSIEDSVKTALEKPGVVFLGMAEDLV